MEVRDGRHLMAFGGAVTTFCAYTVVATAWPELWPLRLVHTVVVLAIGALFMQGTVMVVRAQCHRVRAGRE
ncbi:putative phage holin [Streptomyces drozdowiczii]|uniref:putative phage holin n=1 Tax=Streptomyces drozdowiczii TaxID=202862 RepID=UPI00403CB01B